MALIDNIQIGAHKVLWTPDGETTAIDLGYTAEGVEIAVEGDEHLIEVHELAAPIGGVTNSLSLTAEILLKECHLDNIALGLGALKTTVAGTPAKVSVDISPMRGQLLDFGELRFHPRHLPANDVSRDVVIHKAMVRRQGTQTLRANEDGSVSFSVVGAAAEQSDGSWKLYTIGDDSTDVSFDV